MSLVFNGTEISKIIYNGTELDKLVYNGTPVWESGINYLCFTATQDSTEISLVANGTAPAVSLEYSTDKTNWNTYTVGTAITINANDKLYFRGNNTAFATTTSKYNKFTISKPTYCSGNIMTLLDKTGETTILSAAYTFTDLFVSCTNLLSAPDLPATTLTNYCYGSMFSGCTSLTTAPQLPATILETNCYVTMFYNCTSLTTAPRSLPATTLKTYCYSSMFRGCTSLTTAPSLPATTLANNCYERMFYGCTSLTTSPSLPATTLTPACYSNMFWGCTSLTTLPQLPATTLANTCYSTMFYRCTNIKLSTTQTGEYQTPYRIPYGTEIGTIGTNSLSNMFTSTGGTFAGKPEINTTYYTSNTIV